ncbi:MAG TPA: GGDEF domain-containing protein [Gemmatimonadaceae bacterium]|nr:GGDEF domain-containing protein [Gemmatimonadaceae bacterium]
MYSPHPAGLPAAVSSWLEAEGRAVAIVDDLTELKRRTLRGRPRVVLFDARGDAAAALEACRWLKHDSFTGIVPAAVITSAGGEALAAAFAAGADEVLEDPGSAAGAGGVDEVAVRLDALLRRSDRDTSVHPSTRLPGTFGIEAEIARRLGAGELFGVCYADLDHFKEYNDRYGYYEGDRIIRMLAMILHDVVKGSCGDAGFVGHIGGDDFIFIVPLAAVASTCGEVIEVFDTLIPLQYNEADRRAGYFFGKDRRGRLHRVPLMTLSIGVATNAHRHFVHAAQVSELATEMKTYAKSLPGSVHALDRRGRAGGEGAVDLPGTGACTDPREES